MSVTYMEIIVYSLEQRGLVNTADCNIKMKQTECNIALIPPREEADLTGSRDFLDAFKSTMDL